MKLISSKLTNLLSLEQSQSKHIERYGVIGLIQRHKSCKLGGDKLHRPPVVALNSGFCKKGTDICFLALIKSKLVIEPTLTFPPQALFNVRNYISTIDFTYFSHY